MLVCYDDISIFNLQVDLEYLGHVVFNSDGFLYPDSVVGTYSNTGLGVAGWEVGGIDAEAAILGQVCYICVNFAYCKVGFSPDLVFQ